MAGYNVQALQNYVNEQNLDIIKDSLSGSKTIKLFKANIQVGIKNAEALNIMNIDPLLQDDSVGSSTDSGSEAKFEQRIITVAPIASRIFLDPKVLNKKWMNTQILAGSKDDSVVFEKEIVDQVTERIVEKNETLLWMGNTASGNNDLNRFDGYVKLIDAETGTTVVTAATFTTANALSLIDNMFVGLNKRMTNQPDMAFLMGWDYFKIYTQSLKAANLFHYGAESSDGEITIPGTKIKIYALEGLDGSKRVYADRISNYYIGTDMLGEEETVSVDFLPEKEKIKMKVAYKLGVQIARPKEITVLKVAA